MKVAGKPQILPIYPKFYLGFIFYPHLNMDLKFEPFLHSGLNFHGILSLFGTFFKSNTFFTLIKCFSNLSHTTDFLQNYLMKTTPC